MNDNFHVIKKQFIELELPAGTDSLLQSQQWFEAELNTKLYPRLEALFDNLVGPDRFLDIDRLELDLGDISFEEDSSAWLEQAYQLFKSSLEKSISANPINAVNSKPGSELSAFAWFLQHGMLPWWADNVDLDQQARLMASTRPDTLMSLMESPVPLERWVQQFDAAIQSELAKALGIQPSMSLQAWLELFEVSWRSSAAVLYWRSLWSHVVEKGGQKGGQFSEKDFQALLLENARENKEFLQQPKMLREYKAWLIDVEAVLDKSLVLANEATLKPSNPVHRSEAVASESLYVSLAGTVLVHPFLPTLFNKLEYLQNEVFVDFAAQQRAVHLLYYIATERQQPVESELVLFKLLCGLPLNIPVARFLDLKQSELQEAENMLAALIEHWPAIQGSTPSDLRASFFAREAKLEKKELGWQLDIEQSSIDVLLSRLNWGLSPILHSWMQDSLWVNWA